MVTHNTSFLARVDVVGRKALITDVDKSEHLLKQFYGKPLSISKPKIEQKYREPLILSLYETLYLCKKGLIEIRLGDNVVGCEALEKYYERISHNFSIKYRVYEHLKERNYIIRGGIKYGADFSIYTVGPGFEHAPYVITVVSKNYKLRPADIVALGRVSHSVKKRSVLAIVDEDKNDVHYIVFKWVKL